MLTPILTPTPADFAGLWAIPADMTPHLNSSYVCQWIGVDAPGKTTDQKVGGSSPSERAGWLAGPAAG